MDEVRGDGGHEVKDVVLLPLDLPLPYVDRDGDEDEDQGEGGEEGDVDGGVVG